MIRGIYAAATGMLNRSKQMDIASNNMSNSDTAGFKKDSLATSSFNDYMAYRMSATNSAQIGTMSYGSLASKVYTSYEQGGFDQTDRNLDFALSGDGFFTLQTADGGTALTRNGQFMINEAGYLTNATGSLVLGKNGPIQVGTSEFTVDSSGAIYVGGQYQNAFLISRPADLQTLTKLSDGMYVGNTGAALPFEGQVKQGCVERSNVDATEEMTDIIAGSRGYQSCAQVLKMMDGVLQKSVNEIAKL